MSDERPDALLKSALEKIVWFEARSSQVSNDLAQTRGEGDRLKVELTHAAQREIELRRVVAELEVRLQRAHSEREESARAVEALKRERTELIGKMLEASRIHGAGTEEEFDTLDLASFISQLRSEVVESRQAVALQPDQVSRLHGEPGSRMQPEQASRFQPDQGSRFQPDQGSRFQPEPSSPFTPSLSRGALHAVPSAPRVPSSVEKVAEALKAEGRLSVSASEQASLENAQPFPGRAEETLFGFSVRELSAPDASARTRAADRLKALAHAAAGPALATALHGETEPAVLVALLGAVAVVAKGEAVPVVQPHLSSPHADVRIAALKALLVLDPAQAGPHLSAAVKDPDKTVRRRASLLALGLQGDSALELGTLGIRDVDADVRSLAALVLGASGAEPARALLMDAMRDRDARVRRSAGQALSRLLGQDVMGLVDLDESQRRREVRRLSMVTAKPVQGSMSALDRVRARLQPPVVTAPAAVPAPAPAPAPASRSPLVDDAALRSPRAESRGEARARVAVLEIAPAAPSAELLGGVLAELRASIRGRPLDELARTANVSLDEARAACTVLVEQGQAVRRGLKYFVA